MNIHGDCDCPNCQLDRDNGVLTMARLQELLDNVGPALEAASMLIGAAAVGFCDVLDDPKIGNLVDELNSSFDSNIGKEKIRKQAQDRFREEYKLAGPALQAASHCFVKVAKLLREGKLQGASYSASRNPDLENDYQLN